MLKQNTEAWLEMRKNHIGASDAPIILNLSPYLTPYQLWEQKLGLSPSQFQNQAMKRGHDLEEQARLELEKMTGHFFLPQVKVHHSIPWMMASLDGVDVENKHIAEIKCPNKQDHSLALCGQVPEKYIPQLQHQLEVCQLDMVYYFSFDGAQGAIVKIYRDDKYIKKMLIEEEKFWECMQSVIAPELSEKDYEIRSEDSWEKFASEWISTYRQLKDLEGKEKRLRDSIISMCEKRNSIGGGIKVTRSIRSGTVDYSSIPELQNVQLEKYRKKPVEYFRISAMS